MNICLCPYLGSLVNITVNQSKQFIYGMFVVLFNALRDAYIPVAVEAFWSLAVERYLKLFSPNSLKSSGRLSGCPIERPRLLYKHFSASHYETRSFHSIISCVPRWNSHSHFEPFLCTSYRATTRQKRGIRTGSLADRREGRSDSRTRIT